MGSIYKRGKVYWIKYYRNGKPYRESTKSLKEADAATGFGNWGGGKGRSMGGSFGGDKGSTSFGYNFPPR